MFKPTGRNFRGIRQRCLRPDRRSLGHSLGQTAQPTGLSRALRRTASVARLAPGRSPAAGRPGRRSKALRGRRRDRAGPSPNGGSGPPQARGSRTSGAVCRRRGRAGENTTRSRMHGEGSRDQQGGFGTSPGRWTIEVRTSCGWRKGSARSMAALRIGIRRCSLHAVGASAQHTPSLLLFVLCRHGARAIHVLALPAKRGPAVDLPLVSVWPGV